MLVKKQNPSLEDVAKEAGVHRATVSRALKDDPRISQETKDRVVAAALALGYRPNPLVSLLMSHRRSVTTPAFQGVIAYVTRFGEPGAWRSVSESFVRIFRGAEEAADRHGYRLEEICIPSAKGSSASSARILRARGIQSLLIAPLPKPNGHLRLPWSNFAPVTIGYSLARPDLHRVTTDHFGCLVTAMRQIRRKGFRRIGVMLTGHVNQRTDRRWLGAHLVEMERAEPGHRIPALVTRDWDESAFRDWFKIHRPEVLVGVHMYRVLETLAKMKLTVPGDVRLVSLELRDREKDMAGIDQNFEQIGAASVHALIGMLHRGERGVPSIPQKFLIDGTWKDGTTLA